MQPVFRHSAASVFFVVLLVGLNQNGSRADQPAPFQFVQNYPLTLDWKRLQKDGIEIEIQNNSQEKYTLTIQLSISELKDINGNLIESSKVIRPERDSVSLEKPSTQGETKSVKAKLVVISTTDLKPGVYRGTLTAVGHPPTNSAAPPPSISKDVELVVSEKASVDKWAFNAYRMLPLPFSCLWLHNCPVIISDLFLCDSPLPLDETSEPSTDTLEEGKPLGTLTGSLGGSAVVSSGRKRVLPNGRWGVELAVNGLTHTGKYEGPIYLTPSKEKADVTLTIYGKDFILWPILVMGFSIWLALKVKQYFGVRRKIWGLREQEAELGVKFREQQEKFAEASQGHPYASYSIARGLDDNRRQLRKAIDRLGASSYTTLDETPPADVNQKLDPQNPTYQLIVTELKSLEDQIEAWGKFADEMEALEQGLEQGEKDVSASNPPSDPAGGPQPGEPRFLSEARRLLAGAEISIDEFATLREDVSKATAFSTSWNEVDKTLERYRGWISGLEQRNMSDDQKTQLSDAKIKTEEAWWQLWQVEDADGLNAQAAALEGLEDVLWRLDRATPAPITMTEAAVNTATTAAAPLTLSEAYSLPSRAFAALRDTTYVPDDDAERARYYRKALRRWDTRLAWLALVIALITGLNQFYFGQKPFGSLLDYLAILIWGLSVKVALDALNTGLERVLNLQRPLDSH